MKYKLILDSDNYLTGFVHTETKEDVYELDATKMDLSHLNCYKLENNKVVLDDVKLAEVIAEEKKREEEFIPTEDRLEALEESTLDISVNIGIENEVSVADRLEAIEEAILEIVGG